MFTMSVHLYILDNCIQCVAISPSVLPWIRPSMSARLSVCLPARLPTYICLYV